MTKTILQQPSAQFRFSNSKISKNNLFQNELDCIEIDMMDSSQRIQEKQQNLQRLEQEHQQTLEDRQNAQESLDESKKKLQDFYCNTTCCCVSTCLVCTGVCGITGCVLFC